MSNIYATILIPMDVSAGASAVNYEPRLTNECPILSVQCIGSSGAGVVKITPFRSTVLDLGATAGSGGRLRIATDGIGSIISAEIAVGGAGYPDGPVSVILGDPYGTGASISCTASGGLISSVYVGATGIGYSGYISMDVSDFIEGVSYDFIPRYIEQTSGSGVLRLIGSKMAIRPFQVF